MTLKVKALYVQHTIQGIENWLTMSLLQLRTQSHSFCTYHRRSYRWNRCYMPGAGRRNARDDPVCTAFRFRHGPQAKLIVTLYNSSNIQGYVKAVRPGSDSSIPVSGTSNQTTVILENMFGSANASDIQVQSFREACGYVEWTSVPDHAAGILFSVGSELYLGTVASTPAD